MSRRERERRYFNTVATVIISGGLGYTWGDEGFGALTGQVIGLAILMTAVFAIFLAIRFLAEIGGDR